MTDATILAAIAANVPSTTIELTANEDSYYVLTVPTGTFSFGSGQTVYYNYDSGTLPSFLGLDFGLRTYTGTADQSDVGDYTFVISATTDDVTYEYATIHLTVNNVNDAPSVKSAYGDETVEAGNELDITAASFYFRDADGDTLTYEATLDDGSDLPDWLVFDSATGAFSGTPANADAGTITVKITAKDPSGASRVQTFDIEVVALANNAPTGSPTATLVDGTEDQAYTVSIATLLQGFTDTDGDTLDVTSLTATNGSVEISGDGKSFVITPDTDYYGDSVLHYTVSDGRGGTIDGELTLNFSSADDPTVLTGNIEDQVANEDKPFKFKLPDIFSDSDGSYTIHPTATLADGSALPQWLKFKPNGGGSGTFSGTPANGDVGKVVVRVSAGSVHDDFTINVKNANDAPEVTDVEADKKISDTVRAGETVAEVTVVDEDAKDKLTVKLDPVLSKAFKMEFHQVNTELTVSLLTKSTTDDYLANLKKLLGTLTFTDKSGESTEVDLLFKITHPTSTRADSPDHVEFSEIGRHEAHHGDWSM